jgi:hypothetical protein
VLPDIPSIGENVWGYDVVGLVGNWRAIRHAGCIIEMLNRAINAGLADNDVRTRFEG